jgi:hypothetical protein
MLSLHQDKLIENPTDFEIKSAETKKKKRDCGLFFYAYGRFLNINSVIAMTIIIKTMSPAETGRK